MSQVSAPHLGGLTRRPPDVGRPGLRPPEEATSSNEFITDDHALPHFLANHG